MNPLIQPKTITSPLLITLTLLCFGFFPKTQAVVPPPDGGYPGFNTAEGQNALKNLTTGSGNTAVGWYSIFSATTASFNTALGAGTLALNTADNNTATGAAALLLNTTGVNNTAVGSKALLSNTTGNFNTASSVEALEHNTIGNDNTANGVDALFSNTTGSFNTANGVDALDNNTTGSGNTALGVSAGNNVTTADDVICIGIDGANVSGSCFIGNIRGIQTQNANAIPVLIDSNGQLGTASSSRRFKKEIKAMDQASEAILALKPVTFHYKSDIASTPQFGLIAEEVAAVKPDLVVRDERGEIYTVRYDAVNAMLLNEFLKEHKAFEEEQGKVQEQGATIARLEQQVAALTAGLQKVSAQLEASKPAPQTVLNND